MATVAQILDYATKVSRLNTNAGAERTLALTFLNAVYQEVVVEIGVNVVSTWTQTMGSAASTFNPQLFTASGIVGAPLDIRELTFASGAAVTPTPGSRVDRERMQEYTLGLQGNGPTFVDSTYVFYDVTSPFEVRTYPQLPSGTIITAEGAAGPLALVESSPVAGASESTPTALPPWLHLPLLGAGTIAYANEFDLSKVTDTRWRTQYEVVKQQAKDWARSYGAGTSLPPIRRAAPNILDSWPQSRLDVTP